MFRPMVVVSALLLAALPSVLPAQDAKPVSQSQSEPARTEADVDRLIHELGDASYESRRKAEEQLRSLGKSALPALQKAAEGHEDLEVRSRARRIVRAIENDGQGGLRARTREPRQERGSEPMPLWRDAVPAPQDLNRIFDEMFERMERDFGLDVPRQRFFRDEFFQDLRRQMQDLRVQGGAGEQRAYALRVGPDGVRLEVEEKDASGKSEKKVYEAPDMEAFRKEHPEVAKRYLGGDGVQFRLGFPQWNLGQPPMVLQPRGQGRFRVLPPAQIGEPEMAEPEAIPPGQRLGVQVSPVSEDVAEFLGLPEGVGLRVEEVQADTLAGTLKIQRGDVLVKVGEREIRGTEDVRAALKGIEAGATVRVVVNRKGQEQVLEAAKPATAEPKRELRRKAKAEQPEAGEPKAEIR
ncbi:MAG: PDZ domain-containing protein [Planctomycetes bacterium]|nr:PDZ domain-containing protein [Planctomycetota bacterium]